MEGDQDDTHVKRIAEFAVDAVAAAGNVLIDEDEPDLGYVHIRVGFHSGHVVSNVIGSLNPRYGLFGDTMNTASRMESNSASGMIHCSEISAKLLKEQAPDFPMRKRGRVEVKGKGRMTTYWVGVAAKRNSLGGSRRSDAGAANNLGDSKRSDELERQTSYRSKSSKPGTPSRKKRVSNRDNPRGSLRIGMDGGLTSKIRTLVPGKRRRKPTSRNQDGGSGQFSSGGSSSGLSADTDHKDDRDFEEASTEMFTVPLSESSPRS